MKRSHSVIGLALVGAMSLGGSGCSIQNLKEANRRLKESNDRLISENNRLEEELAGLQRKQADGQFAPDSTAVARAADPPQRKSPGTIKDDLLLDEDGVEVSTTSQGIQLRVPDRVFFGLGQAKLSQRGQRILDKVARLLNADYRGRMVRVDGHTDDTPVRKVRHLYPTNWELSSARACTVVRYLVDNGRVEAQRIFPAGFSYFRPVSAGRSASARSQNRRVEITILNDSV